MVRWTHPASSRFCFSFGSLLSKLHALDWGTAGHYHYSPVDGGRDPTNINLILLILADANSPFEIFVPATHPTPNSDFTVHPNKEPRCPPEKVHSLCKVFIAGLYYSKPTSKWPASRLCNRRLQTRTTFKRRYWLVFGNNIYTAPTHCLQFF